MDHYDGCERQTVYNYGRSDRARQIESGHKSSIRTLRDRIDHRRQLQARDPAIHGVIVCKKDSLQVELAYHNKLIERFNSARYLLVARCYNAAAVALATEALEY